MGRYWPSLLCSPGVITARKLQQKEVNADNVPSICGQKKGEKKALPAFLTARWTPEHSASIVCMSTCGVLPSGWGFFKWMEPSVFGLEKEHTLPELGKANVMPREHNMLTALQWLGSIQLWQGCWVPAFMCFLFHVQHPGIRAGWYTPRFSKCSLLRRRAKGERLSPYRGWGTQISQADFI